MTHKTIPDRTSLLVIYTGGTIGMVQDQDSGTLIPFRFENILEEIPELKNSGFNLASFALDPPVDSSNVKPSLWVKLAEIISERYNEYDGFIILHGTDTMAYSASALSFMLDNLGKPVIFTGSQLPIGSFRTDSKENLVAAVEIAAAKKDGLPVVPEVGIYFENRLYRGNRTTKNSTVHFRAFVSGNYPALAETGVHIRYNHAAIGYGTARGPFRVHDDLCTDVFILKMFPGISRDVVEPVFEISGLRAVILETFGAGNAPEDEWFIKCIRKALQRGLIILSVTQCRVGAVEMGKYETSRKLEEAGVVSGGDMTTEAALTKLMHLTGISHDRSWIVEQLGRSLRGEITL
jgi:L-asparaginase